MLAEFKWIETIWSSPILLVLIGCSVITFAIAIERTLYFWRRRGNPDQTLSQALDKVSGGNIREAAWVFETSPHPLGQVAGQVFDESGGTTPLETIEERMQVTLSQQKLLLERNLAVLGSMAAVAPLIGLLGTVWGIMRAFHDMALTGSAAPSVVAAGVAEALVTTAAGLIVAVPALLLHNHFTRRISVMLTVAENHARSVRAVVYEDAVEDGLTTPEAATGPQPFAKTITIHGEVGGAAKRRAA